MQNDILTTMKKEAWIQLRISKELQKALQDISQREGLPITRVVLSALAKQYPELVDIILKN